MVITLGAPPVFPPRVALSAALVAAVARLSTTFDRLYRTARAAATPEAPGSAVKQLDGRTGLQIRAQGRKRQAIFSRARVPVSDGELTIYRREGNIPDDAERGEYRDTKGWCYVAYRWEVAPDLWEHGLPQEELPI